MDIPNTAVGLFVGTGVLLILASIFGGGLEIKEIKIPTITVRMRVLAFAIGVVLIALPIAPDLDLAPTPDDGGPDVTDNDTKQNARPVVLGQLTGMSESDAGRRIRDLELAVGEVSRRSQWAPDGFVVAQSAGGALSAGDTVDLIVADSEFSFRSSRRVRSEDEDISATVEYTVRRLRQDATSGDIGEVSITRLTLSPETDKMSRIVDRLVSSNGYVRLDNVENIDLIASWEALADLERELVDSMAMQRLSSDDQGFESLGEGVLLILAMIELEFDIRSILAPPPGILGNNAETVELQSGSAIKSSIRLQGEPATVAAGEAYSFDVARRVPGDEDFKNVGRATYAARDGLLRSLSAGFFLGTTEDSYLQLQIERL